MLVVSVADVVGGGRALAADAHGTASGDDADRRRGAGRLPVAHRRAHRADADPREVVTRIRELNGMRSNLIHPGQVLLVPSTL